MTGTEKHVIETQGLSKSFGEVQALRGVELRVPHNSIFGFLAPNCAGKTTLMKTLLGLSRPTSGRGTIFGHDIVRESVEIRDRIGYLPQHPRFIEYMTARENLEFTARFSFNGPQPQIRERCDEMLELVGLAEKADRPIKGYSGGEKQHLGITLVTGFLAPYVEELYFRGFLLLRMAWMGKWAPLVEAYLFALYHFWSPWQLATRFLAVLPLVYVVYWNRNLHIGVAAHWILNVVGPLELLVAAFK